jgi:X-Pro dipeptidyl-peptidase
VFSQSADSTQQSILYFNDGEAQVVNAFSDAKTWIKEELWVETTFDTDFDGKPDRMHVFVTRPMQTQLSNIKLPVIYMTSPYFGLSIKNLLGVGGNKYNWSVEHELGQVPNDRKHTRFKTRSKRPLMSAMYDKQWVPRGYIMVYSSSPGTGMSDGAPTIAGENESLAPKAVIDWLCGRAKGYTSRNGSDEVKAYWCSGKVGMTGTSYDGTLCLAAATTGVDGLKAIIPVAPVSSFYHYYRSNGLVRSPQGYLGEDADVMYDVINTGKKSNRKIINREVRDKIIRPGMDRIRGDYNAFWDARDYVKKIDNMKAALLMAHGFNDWNVMAEHSYRFYKAAKEKGLPTQLFYHQGGHGGDPSMTMMNRWFTKYLHGVDNAVELDTPVVIFREKQTTPTKYLQYPDAAAHDVTFYVHSVTQGDGQLQMQKPNASQTQSFIDDYRIPGLRMLDSINAKHRLLFVTPPLKNDLRLSGIPSMKLAVSSNKPAANVSLYLVAINPDSSKKAPYVLKLINRTWADPQNHESLTVSKPMEPNQFYILNVNFMPDDEVIPKGARIALMIFSSDKEFTLHPKPGTQLTVDLNQCALTLPLVGRDAISYFDWNK